MITTAAVPGQRAPILITRDMVARMSSGSVLVDLAAEQGGNCELTQPGEQTTENGVTIIGCVNLPASVPFHASQTYSKNISTFLLSLIKDGQWSFDPTDELVAGTLVTRGGDVVHPRVLGLLESTF